MLLRASIVMSVCLSVAACGDDEPKASDTRDTTEVFVPPDVSSDTGPNVEVADTTPEVADTTPEVADTTPEVADTTPEVEPRDTTEVTDTQAETVADTEVADTEPETTAETEVTIDTSDTSDDVPDVVAGCDHVGFTSIAADGIAFTTGDTWYLSQDTLDAPVNVLSVEIYAALGGAQGPGTYPITDENYADCGNCVLVQTGCDDTLFNCARTFLATSGSLQVISIGGQGARFNALLTDVKLVEITYTEDYFSTPVVGGETWCVPSHTIDVVLQ